MGRCVGVLAHSWSRRTCLRRRLNVLRISLALTRLSLSPAETREDRVHDWRNFNKKKKKSKKGPEVLG